LIELNYLKLNPKRSKVMNWDTAKGDVLEAARGRRDLFEGLLKKKFGLAKEEVKRQVDEFESSCGCR
jgi:hypothetical protein